MNKGDPMKEWFHEWMAEKPPNGRAALFWDLQSFLIACTSFSKFMTELTESRLWQKTKFSTNWPQLLDYRQAVGGRRTTGFVSNGQLVSQKEVNFRWFLRINSHRFFLSNKCKLWSFSEQIRQSSVEQIWVWKVKVFLHTPTCFGMRRLSVLIWGFSAFFFFFFYVTMNLISCNFVLLIIYTNSICSLYKLDCSEWSCCLNNSPSSLDLITPLSTILINPGSPRDGHRVTFPCLTSAQWCNLCIFKTCMCFLLFWICRRVCGTDCILCVCVCVSRERQEIHNSGLIGLC